MLANVKPITRISQNGAYRRLENEAPQILSWCGLIAMVYRAIQPAGKGHLLRPTQVNKSTSEPIYILTRCPF